MGIRAITDAAGMPPALVLGFGHAGSLGVIRSLGRKGIPHVDVGTRGTFVAYSRWHRPWPDPQWKHPTPSSLPQFLAGLPFERMVLIPCTDQWLAAAAALDPSLTARFPASMAPETIPILLDKGRFAEAASSIGVPHPKTIWLESQDDLAGLPDAVLQESFIKPRNTRAFQALHGVKATRFKTRSEAIAFLLEARRAGLELMLQEYIPGPATCHYRINGFVDSSGVTCVYFAYQWLRRHARDLSDIGGSYGVSIPLTEVTAGAQSVNRLLGALRYRGMFNAQLKYDERDGLFKILEVNPRPGPWVSFAAACGVDVVEMAYRDALSLPVKPVTVYEVGRYFLDPYLDLVIGWRLLRKGRLTLWAWMLSWLGATQMTFCLSDPVPGLFSFFSRVLSLVRRRLRVRRVRPNIAPPPVMPHPGAADQNSNA